MRYLSWDDLIGKWSAGMKDLAPSRSRWKYRVEDDILICENEAVGLPCDLTRPRMFFYLISHWRDRVSDREKLERLGGVPILPFEMVLSLKERDRLDLCPKDYGPDDWAALDFVRAWVRSGTSREKEDFVHWRDCVLMSSAATEAGSDLWIARRVRGVGARKTLVATLSTDRELRLLGQVCRSPRLSWVKDAVWVAASREMGSGSPKLIVSRIGPAGCGKSKRVGGKITIRPTPKPMMTAGPIALAEEERHRY